MRRVLISGITGHVGSVLSRRLMRMGVRVCGITRQEHQRRILCSEGIEGYKVSGELTELPDVFARFKPDVVVHLAARARRWHQMSDVEPFVRANILFGANLLEAMRAAGCRRFVTAESVLQFSANGCYHPFNLYSATKQAFADILSYYADEFGITAIALVLPTIYSEFEHSKKLMTDTARAFVNGTMLELRGEDVPIDFLHVEDAADAFVRAMVISEELDGSRGVQRYWIGSGSPVTPSELVALFERSADMRVSVKREGTGSGSRREAPYRGPGLPGWIPKVPLEIGIRRMLSMQK